MKRPHDSDLLERDRMHAALDEYSPSARTSLTRRYVRQLKQAEANAAQAKLVLCHIADWGSDGEGLRLIAAAHKLEET